VGRHVAPPELARIGGGTGYQHDAPLELPFPYEGAVGSWSVSTSGRNGKPPPGAERESLPPLVVYPAVQAVWAQRGRGAPEVWPRARGGEASGEFRCSGTALTFRDAFGNGPARGFQCGVGTLDFPGAGTAGFAAVNPLPKFIRPAGCLLIAGSLPLLISVLSAAAGCATRI